MEAEMKSAAEIVGGFPSNQKNRGRSVMLAAQRETSLALAGEVEKILDIFSVDAAEAVLTIRSWVKATREAAEKENQ
jgi:hypothetical protein